MTGRAWLVAGLLVASLVPVGAAPAAGVASAPVVSATRTVLPPDTRATDFGNGFGFDATRLAAAATLGTSRVLYVFDRQPDGSWRHSATIPAPAGATSSWGGSVAVSGTTIAVTDSGAQRSGERSGQIDVFDRVGGSWTRTQTLIPTGNFQVFGVGVWLVGDALFTTDGITCDANCGYGPWRLYERNGTAPYVESVTATDSNNGVSVGVDGARLAVATPSRQEATSCSPVSDAHLDAFDVSRDPAARLLDLTVTAPEFVCEEPLPDDFQRVDLSGGVLVSESCCATERTLRVRRDAGSGYAEEATLPTSGRSDALAVIPDVILRADRAARVFHTHGFRNGAWAVGDDIAFPADVALPSPDILNRGVAATGDTVGLRGTNVVHLLTITLSVATCDGRPVTVDLNQGHDPTVGNDVILGTPGNDQIDALAGDDIVCAGAGNDLVAGNGGNDGVRGGPGVDIITGGAGRDFLVGDTDNDAIFGGDGVDVVVGVDGNDYLVGGNRDDHLFGGAGNDTLNGGNGSDHCSGDTGTDTAANCELTTGVA